MADVAVVVHRGPHPADALLASPPPQQGVPPPAAFPQQHAQYPRARPVHVEVEDQTLGGRGAPQVRGQQPGLVTRAHRGRLDVHEVTWTAKPGECGASPTPAAFSNSSPSE